MSTPMIAPNYHIGAWDLLWNVLEHIETHWDEYYQGAWCRRWNEARVKLTGTTKCNTTRCVAGWIAHFAGWVEEIESGNDTSMYATKDGVRMQIQHAALTELQLNPERYPMILTDTCGVEGCGCEYSLDADTDRFATDLFGACESWWDILTRVKSLATADEQELPAWFQPALDKAWRDQL